MLLCKIPFNSEDLSIRSIFIRHIPIEEPVEWTKETKPLTVAVYTLDTAVIILTFMNHWRSIS